MALKKEFVDRMREKMINARHEILNEMAHHLRDEHAIDVMREPEYEDEGYKQTARHLLQSLENEERARIEEIDRALERIRTKDYGMCTDCGEEIGTERLEAYPEAPRCIECQNTHERDFQHRGEV